VAGYAELEKAGVRSAMMRAIEEAHKKAHELGKK
jgi:pyrroline-5-carboxylate reductase